MKTLLQIQVVEIDGEKAIDILRTGYNFIDETIYNDELASKILQLINENRQNAD